MATPGYKVRLDAFEGPLDLLLHLVRTNELDIYHLPVATITDQYLAYLEMFQELNLDIAGEYLVMAASLMYMKSRLLLPVDDEEDEEQEDPVQDLVRQLAEYQRYREVADALRDRALLHRDVFRRDPTPEDVEPGEQELAFKVELADLFEGLRRVLEAAAARRPHVLEAEEYSVADCVRQTVARLRGGGRIEFRHLFDTGAPRGRIIATFIGLLELIKLGVVDAEQRQQRGPITLALTGPFDDAQLADLVETYGSGHALAATLGYE